MEKPLVSIIIVNYCGQKLLEKCLHSLLTTTYTNYDVIIVDNNSTDSSVEFLSKHFPDIHVIQLNKNFGFAAPNNIAAKVAKGKYLVFLNNDTVVTKDWLTPLVNALEKDKTTVIGQSLLLLPDGNVDSSGDFIDEIGRAFSLHDVPKKMRYILSARGACMIVRRDTFLDFGGFDENYFASFEDVDLGWKTWLWGYKVVLVPDSIVYHSGGETIKRISETIAFHGVKNNIVLRLTNFDFSDSIKSFFIIGIIILAQKLFRISLINNIEQKLNIPDIKTILRAGLWVLKNTRKIKEKRKILKSRQVRTNQELKNMGLISEFKR